MNISKNQVVATLVIALFVYTMFAGSLVFTYADVKQDEFYLQGAWARLYPAGYGRAYSVIRSSDGGYVMAGYTDINPSGPSHLAARLLKVYSNGTPQWDRLYIGSYSCLASCVGETSDGGYIIAGYSRPIIVQSLPIDFNALLIKTFPNGTAQWTRSYGGSNEDVAASVQQTSDGGFIFTGRTESYGNGGSDLWLVKTSQDGTPIWNTTFGGVNYDDGCFVQQNPDGGYTLAGSTSSYGFGTCFWLLNASAGGTLLWNKTYPGSGDDQASYCSQTSDGGYILVGTALNWYSSTRPYTWQDAYLVKTDSAGNLQWNQTYGGAATDLGYYARQTSDGGYLVTGGTYSFPARTHEGDEDVLLVKTFANGSMQWLKTYGDGATDEAVYVEEAADGGYIFAGTSQSNLNFTYGFWLTEAKERTPSILTVVIPAALVVATPFVLLSFVTCIALADRRRE
jgi:hypothetical protein